MTCQIVCWQLHKCDSCHTILQFVLNNHQFPPSFPFFNYFTKNLSWFSIFLLFLFKKILHEKHFCKIKLWLQLNLLTQKRRCTFFCCSQTNFHFCCLVGFYPILYQLQRKRAKQGQICPLSGPLGSWGHSNWSQAFLVSTFHQMSITKKRK